MNRFESVNIETNPKLGFYTVGQNVYYSKVQALIESTKTGEFPHWNFNNNVYGAQVWTEEPEESLATLYQQRAQQLRDQYDYIRLECSGGADSTQTLFSFVLNGIHIDEIVFRYPKTGTEKLDVTLNYEAKSHLLEYEYATRPLLEWVKVNCPEVKITVHDYSNDMLVNEDRDESWVFSAKEFLQPAHVTKFPNYQTIEHKYLADSGKRICVLYGIDKPKMCIRDGEWYAYFMDFQANYANPDMGEYTNITNEYFYWSPDLPAITVKQAHTIRNWFNDPANQHLQHLARWPNHSVAQRTAYEQMIKPLIYPDYDHLTFQVGKPGSNFYSEMDEWFYQQFQDHKLYRSWMAGINFVETQIDPKFFNREFGRAVGFIGFLTPFYSIGPAQQKQRVKHYGIELADRF